MRFLVLMTVLWTVGPPPPSNLFRCPVYTDELGAV